MSQFCKRHYEAIATAMQEARRELPENPEGINVACNNLADLFARDSGLFKRDRFIRACEPGANVRARS